MMSREVNKLFRGAVKCEVEDRRGKKRKNTSGQPGGVEKRHIGEWFAERSRFRTTARVRLLAGALIITDIVA
jgi:hypothetical protein